MISEWIMTEGGPLIVIDESLKRNWGGIFRLTIRDAETRNDYDRACRVTSHVGLIPIVGGNSLIIGDIPMDSCFWSLKSDHSGILQVCYCNNDFDAHGTMDDFARKMEMLEPEQTISFHFQGCNLVMFDSSDGGDRGPKLVSSAFRAGSYSISTYIFEPDDQTSLVVHAFTRLSD